MIHIFKIYTFSQVELCTETRSQTVSPEGKPATIFTTKVRVTSGNLISLMISPTLNTDLFLVSPAEIYKREGI